jgi:hypothetical protein
MLGLDSEDSMCLKEVAEYREKNYVRPAKDAGFIKDYELYDKKDGSGGKLLKCYLLNAVEVCSRRA